MGYPKNIEAVFDLPADMRAKLAGDLIRSLDDGERDEGAEAAWNKEIARRVESIRRGEVKMLSWDEVKKGLVKKPSKKKRRR